MKKTSAVNVVAIFGFPIEHSLSPVMQNAGFRELNLNYTYVPFCVNPIYLKDAITALRALNFKGANITVPHKEEVIEYLDEITEDAFLIGAVNTIVNVDGRLIGYNTDCKGFVSALKSAGITRFDNINALVIGAGGAGKAACVGLLKANIKNLIIANRTVRKAELILENFKKSFEKTKISVCPLEENSLKTALENCDLLINTTSVGMQNESLALPIESLKKGALVYDMVYNPPKTKLLKDAEKLGHKIENGLNMLLYQGVEGFEIWTKKKAPVQVMKQALFDVAYK